MKVQIGLLFALIAFVTTSCSRELVDLELSGWEQDSDMEFVFIDDVVYSTNPMPPHIFIHYHVDASLIPFGNRLVGLNVYRDGGFRYSRPFHISADSLTDATVVFGHTYSYELEFIEAGPDTTRRFGPFVILVQ